MAISVSNQDKAAILKNGQTGGVVWQMNSTVLMNCPPH
jgi:hypothetical protein